MFGLSKKIRRYDPVFGAMLYMGDKVRYWEGKARFSPTGDPIEVFVDGGSDGSMAQQHGFYETVCQHWSEWVVGIQNKLRGEAHLIAEEKLTVTSLSIPNTTFTMGAEWEVSFEDQSGRSYTIEMKGPFPGSVVSDT